MIFIFSHDILNDLKLFLQFIKKAFEVLFPQKLLH
jgi:hypothetical protein